MDSIENLRGSISTYVFDSMLTVLEPDTATKILNIIIGLDKLDNFNLIYFKNNIEYNPINRFEDVFTELFHATEDRGPALVTEIYRITMSIVKECFENMLINHNFTYLYQIGDFVESLYEFIWTDRVELIDELKVVLEEEDDEEVVATFYEILNKLNGCGDFYINETVFDTSIEFIKTLISRNDDINKNDNINIDEISYNILKTLPSEYISTNAYKRIITDDYDINVNLVNNLKALYRDISNDNKIVENCTLYLLLSHDSKADPLSYIDTIDFNLIEGIEEHNINNYKQLIRNEINRIKS